MIRWCAAILLLLVISGCKKNEPTTWESDWIAPVVSGRLDFSNLVNQGYVESGSANEIVLVYENDLLSLSVAELVDIPDTTIKKALTVPFAFLNVPPGASFLDEPQDFQYNGINGALTKIIVRSGHIAYRLSSPIQEETVVNYTIPGASKNGIPLNLSLTVPAASPNERSVIEGTFDLAGYVFDLTGLNGNSTNTFESNLMVQVSPNASGNTVVTNTDTIYMWNTFESIVLQYAKGYFGKHIFTEQSSNTKNTLFSKILGGGLDIGLVNVELYLKNGIGADGRLTINHLRGLNTNTHSFIDLQHQLIGQSININRAVNTGYGFTPTQQSYKLNNLNSNIDLLLENLPNYIGYDAEIEINPLGNVSNGTDFLYYESALTAGLRFRLPLEFKATGLTIQDTFDLDINTGPIEFNNIELAVTTENFFPFSVEPICYIIDENLTIRDTLYAGTINSGTFDTNGDLISPANQESVFNINAANLEFIRKSGKIILRYVINTPPGLGRISIRDYHYLDVRIIASGGIKVKIE